MGKPVRLSMRTQTLGCWPAPGDAGNSTSSKNQTQNHVFTTHLGICSNQLDTLTGKQGPCVFSLHKKKKKMEAARERRKKTYSDFISGSFKGLFCASL